ncbi:MAG: Tm-1-like ATP-binding domain-containing protein [Anditalea sp.]
MIEKKQSILMLGCFDTKEENFSFLRQCILSHGENVVSINTGVMGSTSLFPVDFESDLVAIEAGHTIEQLRQKEDRGYAVEVMGRGAGNIISRLLSQGSIKAAIGMGGGGGTYIALAAMQALPLGMPKFCISTLAAKDLTRQVGMKDITLMPSVVDVAGLNHIIKPIIRQAAAAVSAMSNVTIQEDESTLGSIAISMFGNTTACVDQCTELLKKQGYEVLAFHANGLGGRAMETLIREGCFDAVLDITTTELADELCGGICSAGPGRLTAAAEMGIPQVVVPGCLDMVNFAHLDTVPEQFKFRELYSWAPDVTLMRTNKEENIELGKIFAEKLNQSSAPTSVLLPVKGLSQIDAEGGIFYQPETNLELFETIKKHASESVKILEVNAHINEKFFSEMAVKVLLEKMGKNKLKKV